MKVLIVNSLYHPNGTGGAEKNTKMVAEEFVKRGIDVSVASTSDRDHVDYVNGVKVYYIRTRNLYWGLNSKFQPGYRKPLWHAIDAYNPFMVQKIEEIVRIENPDIAQTNSLSGFSPGVWPVLKKHRIPILHILHDHYLLCLKTTMFSGLENCYTQCLPCRILSAPKRKLSAMVDGVAGVSNYILNRHLDMGYFKNAKLKLRLANLFDIPQNPPERDISDRVRFGFVGLLSPGKGIELLLEQFKRYSDSLLFIYGKGETPEYEEVLRNKYEHVSNIKFMGFNSNLRQVYHSFDVLVIPSLWNETAGRVVVEAYSYGLPVIASSRGGIAEYVDDGITGFVFNPGEPESLSEKIGLFLTNRGWVTEMSANCLKKARNFAREKTVEEYIRAHECLLGN